MIFVGDVAIPRGLDPRLHAPDGFWTGHQVIANLEGAVLSSMGLRPAAGCLYNDEANFVSLAKTLNIAAVSLANNHVADLGDSINRTANVLRDHGVGAFGAGDTIGDAAAPFRLTNEGQDVLLLGFGWDVVQCVPATDVQPGVNPLRADHVLGSIREAREKYPNAKIVLFMHWNYELEAYPQPMDRELAFDTIDAGASAVIGCHSHCVGGIEVYKGAPIVYSLGNWFLPTGNHFGIPVRFPDLSARQLAFEWNPKSGRSVCHWFHFDRTANVVRYERSEELDASAIRAQLTPFHSLRGAAYERWFRKHRRKRKLLPIYKSHKDAALNRLRNAWVTTRQHGVEILAKTNLKSVRS